jgi:hypothetical protein
VAEAIAQCEHGKPARFSKRAALAVLAALTGVYAISLLLNPPEGNYFTICGFKNLSGLPCPGCGLTHSFCALAKGNLPQAFSYNLLGPPLFLFSVMFWIRSVAVLIGWTRRISDFDRAVIRAKPAHLFIGAFAVYGLARVVFLIVFRSGGMPDTPLSRVLGWLLG